MQWSHPAARMRELILAMRAIWACWNDGAALDFRGEFYRHTLMTPFFNPGPTGHGPPKVFLAAVGEHMTEVAGEVADGILIHGFTTERYVREVTMPAVERGLAKAGRSREGFEVSGPLFVVTGTTEEEIERAKTETRQQIAFYGSTPNYRPVLDLHGWGDLQPELNALSKQGKWVEMGELIDDDILSTFAVVAEPGRRREGVGRAATAMSSTAARSTRRTAAIPTQWRSVIADLKPRAVVPGAFEPQHRLDRAVGVLLRAEVPDAGHHFDRSVRQPLRDDARQVGRDALGELAAHDERRRLHVDEACERAVVRAHREHLRLDLGPALELEHAVTAVAEAVIDVRAQRLFGHDVERRLRRVRRERVVLRCPFVAAPARRRAMEKSWLGGSASSVGKMIGSYSHSRG